SWALAAVSRKYRPGFFVNTGNWARTASPSNTASMRGARSAIGTFLQPLECQIGHHGFGVFIADFFQSGTEESLHQQHFRLRLGKPSLAQIKPRRGTALTRRRAV